MDDQEGGGGGELSIHRRVKKRRKIVRNRGRGGARITPRAKVSRRRRSNEHDGEVLQTVLTFESEYIDIVHFSGTRGKRDVFSGKYSENDNPFDEDEDYDENDEGGLAEDEDEDAEYGFLQPWNSPLVITIENSSKHITHKTNFDDEQVFNIKKEHNLLSLAESLKKATTRLKQLYERVVIGKNVLFHDNGNTIKTLAQCYRKWIIGFMRNYYGNLSVGNSETINEDNFLIHLNIEISRSHRILMECTHGCGRRKRRKRDRNRRREDLEVVNFFWYIPFIGGNDDTNPSRNEIEILMNLPPLSETSSNNMKFLPESLILFKKKKFMEMNLLEVLKSITLIMQNQQLDVKLYKNYRKRIHIMYYIEVLISRLDEFVNQGFGSEILNVEQMRFKSSSGNMFYSNMFFFHIFKHLSYFLRFNFFVPKLFDTRFKYLRCEHFFQEILQNEKKKEEEEGESDDDENINFGMINGYVENLTSFLISFIEESVSGSEETMFTFFQKMSQELILSSLIPGIIEYNMLINSLSVDMWDKFVINIHKRSELLKKYIPETHKFIESYTMLFAKTLNDKNSNLVFDDFIKSFMEGCFYRRKGFEDLLINGDFGVFKHDTKQKLKLNKKLQYPFMYPAQVVQNVTLLSAFSRLFNSISFRNNLLFNQCVVLFHELYYMTPSALNKVFCNSFKHPIIIQTSPMRFDVLFKTKFYYCNHDIRCSITTWMLFVYHKCNGKILNTNISENIKGILKIKERKKKRRREVSTTENIHRSLMMVEDDGEDETTFQVLKHTGDLELSWIFNPVKVIEKECDDEIHNDYNPEGFKTYDDDPEKENLQGYATYQDLSNIMDTTSKMYKSL